MQMKQQLQMVYQTVRTTTTTLCKPLALEDYVIQSIEDVSPPKWHLAHTTWFFETFLLQTKASHYQPFDPSFQYLFNSYYQSINHPYPRDRRGLLSRPTVERIYNYRAFVDQAMMHLIESQSEESLQSLKPLITLGLHHEQQHQELLLMDIKHNFSIDPTFPVYTHKKETKNQCVISPIDYTELAGGIVEIGNLGNDFCFDNELPRHKQFLNPYKIANRLVTNGEYLEFILAGGYQQPEWWLADAWDYIRKYHWQAPLYWYHMQNDWYVFTLSGLCELDLKAPLVHVSYYEADAYASWRDKRLPTGAEWEHFIHYYHVPIQEGHFLESNIFQPQPSLKPQKMASQLFGDVWEWTATPYKAYPGYKPPQGALGEYNGKFMTNQMELRGGSCVTPESHIRTSYRNFFQPEKRWQFSGIRLASNL